MSEDTDLHVTDEATPLSPSLESFTASSISLTPHLEPTTPECSREDSREQVTARSCESTPSYLDTARSRPSSSSPLQVWDTRCECGGISPHHHGQPRDVSKMNGIHPPTGPRGDPATNKTRSPTSPSTPSTATGGAPKRNGPMPNYVQVARAYVFEQEIQRCLRENGVSQAREDNIRLAGVQWIDNVRRALKL